jgi:ssDNA-binding Zn-finger/Zn-ribbon topoisomerase 1
LREDVTQVVWISKVKISPETELLLKKVITHFSKEDQSIRERQLMTWRRLKLFWEGFSQTWYSEVAHDWRIWDETANSDDTGQASYDKPVNIFRAYLESIIAALSVTVPPVKCFPDDADNTLDLSTAKAGDKIANLIYKHNDVPLLWLHSLFIFCTEGMVGCYCYPKAHESYGTYEKRNYKDDEEEHSIVRCPSCGYNIADSVTGQTGEIDPQIGAMNDKLEQNQDMFMPGDEDIPVQDYINQEGTEFCPACAQQIIPLLVKETLVVTRLVGVTNEPKTRVCMEAYGGLNIKVSNYARKQDECLYLFYDYETHYAKALDLYKDVDRGKLRDKIKGPSGPKDPYEAWARLSPQYQNAYPENTVTVRQAWLRPASFNVLSEEECDTLTKKFPNGAKVALVNDEFAEACNESLDDCWTLTYNPLSDYIHYDPLGLFLVSVQELVNDLLSLTIQTIEHGIPQTFADPDVLNFNAYRQMESTPGGIYEAKPKSGKTLQEAFHEVKTASLSGEVFPFFNQLQSLGQLVSGALPSLFGGVMQGQGETASQYSMSRAQALQRLQNTWKMLTYWWKNIFGKAVPMFIEEVQEDLRDVQRKEDGSFINVFIRKAELEGKIGKVELEANENLPTTWAQRKDVLMQLLQTGTPEILQILGSPENLSVIREAIGLDAFFVPGEDDVEKQLEEIKELLASEPYQEPDQMTGQITEVPTVEVDPDYDNHAIQFEICRKWIISEEGRQAKTDNPAGYKNVLLHGKMHLQFVQQAQMGQQMAEQGNGAPNPEKPNTYDSKAPIKGEENVQTQ